MKTGTQKLAGNVKLARDTVAVAESLLRTYEYDRPRG